jgi:hypothetical protein
MVSLQDRLLEPLLFLLYVNDLPKIANNKFKIVLYADDTSVIISNHNCVAFISEINNLFKHKWLVECKLMFSNKLLISLIKATGLWLVIITLVSSA